MPSPCSKSLARRDPGLNQDKPGILAIGGAVWGRLADKHTRDAALASLLVTGVIFLWMLATRLPDTTRELQDIFSYLYQSLDFRACVPYAAALLLALWPPVQRAGLSLASWCSRHPWQTGLISALALAFGARFVYHAHPLSMDEYAPLFQSRIFAAGELSGRLPPELLNGLVPSGFQNVFIKVARDTGGVISMYWPGHALLLTPFTALGVPWLLNPLIGGATVVVMQKLGWELFGDHQRSGLAMLCTLGSAAVTINAMSFYSMPAHLLANALFALMLVRPSAPRAFAAGLIGSLALVLHNPVPHLLFALPWFAFLAVRRDRLKTLASLLIGYLPLSLLIGLGWIYFFREFGVTPSALAPAPVAEIGPIALAIRLAGRVFTLPTEQIVGLRIIALGKLWLWSAPALLTFAAVGAWRKHNESGVWFVLGGSALLTYIGYLFVPYSQGHGWSYRYFHGAWLVLPLFAVAALNRGQGTRSLSGYLAGCALLGVIAMTTVHALEVERFIRAHLAQLPEATAARSDAPRVLIVDTRKGFYAQDLVQNDPFLRDRLIILISRGREADQATMRLHFPRYVRLSEDERGSSWGLPAAH